MKVVANVEHYGCGKHEQQKQGNQRLNSSTNSDARGGQHAGGNAEGDHRFEGFGSRIGQVR